MVNKRPAPTADGHLHAGLQGAVVVQVPAEAQVSAVPVQQEQLQLVALDDALLRAPSVTGHPDEGGVESGGRGQELAGVVAAEEQNGHAGVGLLQELADHRLVGLLGVGASHLHTGRAAES